MLGVFAVGDVRSGHMNRVAAAAPCTHRNFGLFLEIVRLTEPSGERMAMTRQGSVSGLAVALCAMAALLSAQSAAAATGEIHGKVTDHLGDPIAGITVCAHGLTMFVGGECDWQTDSQGEYSISGLQPASYRVGFHNEGNTSLNYVPQWYSGKAHPEEADPVELGSGESREINAQLQTGGQFKGTILALNTDLPIEGVEVCANSVDFRQDEEFGYCGRSNAAGEFAVKNLGTGHYRLELRTEGHVNYVEEQLPQAPGSIALTAGGEIEIEAHLVPGIEIDGTMTEAGTGTPIAPFESSVCALGSATEARVKCAPVESAGQYAIPGLPPGTYAVAFSLDWVEEGLDLHPDGYVRRYWEEVPSFDEAKLLSGSPGTVFDEIDAALSKGEEVFPDCEVPSACPPPPSETSSSDGGGIIPAATTLPGGPVNVRPGTRKPCKKGFHRVTKNGHAHCAKIRKKKHRPTK